MRGLFALRLLIRPYTVDGLPLVNLVLLEPEVNLVSSALRAIRTVDDVTAQVDRKIAPDRS
jgi:hypothetical protein